MTDSDIEIVNPDHYLFTIADGASLKATMTVATNRGYVPADETRRMMHQWNIGCRFNLHTSEKSQLSS